MDANSKLVWVSYNDVDGSITSAVQTAPDEITDPWNGDEGDDVFMVPRGSVDFDTYQDTADFVAAYQMNAGRDAVELIP